MFVEGDFDDPGRLGVGEIADFGETDGSGAICGEVRLELPMASIRYDLEPGANGAGIGFVSQSFIRDGRVLAIGGAVPELVAKGDRVGCGDDVEAALLGELVPDGAEFGVRRGFDEISHPAVGKERG